MPTHFTGKCSTFGGPKDTGVSPSEGLALFDKSDLAKPIAEGLFLPLQPPGTTGLARRLDPEAHYIACRWDYKKHPRAWLRTIQVEVHANGRILLARPVDWGPHIRTRRVADLSPTLAAHLGVKTDDRVMVVIPDR